MIRTLAALLLLTIFEKSACYNPFFALPKVGNDKPKLILIAGCPGTGKSTFGMTVALDHGILKCISTDTVRAVMRSFVPKELSPALHRSSYAQAYTDDNPVRSWKETCSVLDASVESLVDDAISRHVSLVIEGVHIVPSSRLIKKWEDSGGVALGVLLQIQDAEVHKRLLTRRGFTTGRMGAEKKKMGSYDRIREIQAEMMRLAQESGWLQIEQKTEPDPLELVTMKLFDNFTNGKTDDAKSVKENVVFSGLPSETVG